MTSDRTILITGVTGKQGRAGARGHRFHLRGLTRMPQGKRAAALARHGGDVVKGDLDNEATLGRALAGVWGVFGVQNTGEWEEAQGKRLATLSREAGVKHFVYASVGSAHKRTGIPHFGRRPAENAIRPDVATVYALQDAARPERTSPGTARGSRDVIQWAGSGKTLVTRKILLRVT